jgi:hypothetical protein
MSLCRAAGSKITALAFSAFTLSWTHSVERIRWEEDWQLTSRGLELVEARVKGSGAGMEPPPEAKVPALSGPPDPEAHQTAPP